MGNIARLWMRYDTCVGLASIGVPPLTLSFEPSRLSEKRSLRGNRDYFFGFMQPRSIAAEYIQLSEIRSQLLRLVSQL